VRRPRETPLLQRRWLPVAMETLSWSVKEREQHRQHQTWVCSTSLCIRCDHNRAMKREKERRNTSLLQWAPNRFSTICDIKVAVSSTMPWIKSTLLLLWEKKKKLESTNEPLNINMHARTVDVCGCCWFWKTFSSLSKLILFFLVTMWTFASQANQKIKFFSNSKKKRNFLNIF
jgi:hypothetical protein